MRIAFVTTEYVSEVGDSGGLANYLARMSRALIDRGHVVEVFVTSQRCGRLIRQDVLVHRVDPSRWERRFGAVPRIAAWLPPGEWAARCSAPILGRAAALGAALRAREREVTFDLVQSADYQAAGLFIARRGRRTHVVRFSSAADLWGRNSWESYWERTAARRADRAYAPSRFIAGYLADRYALDVGVVRPPVFREIAASTTPVAGLPARFLIHFGQIGRNKGADVLASALPQVWRREPDVRMVWAGRPDVGADFPTWRQMWGRHADHVTYLGALTKPDLYQVLLRADASVLPSRVDNLPNTVIESLLCDKPVIGTRRSSIDELVVDGVNGRLVDYGNNEALADAIVEEWRRGPTGATELLRRAPIWDDLTPDAAVQRFLEFAMGSRRDRDGGDAFDARTFT